MKGLWSVSVVKFRQRTYSLSLSQAHVAATASISMTVSLLGICEGVGNVADVAVYFVVLDLKEDCSDSGCRWVCFNDGLFVDVSVKAQEWIEGCF